MKNQDGESQAVLLSANPSKLSNVLGLEDSYVAEAPVVSTGSSECPHPAEMCNSKPLVEGSTETPVSKKEGMCDQGLCGPDAKSVL